MRLALNLMTKKKNLYWKKLASDAIIEFDAPWCGHCEAQKYEKTGYPLKLTISIN